MNLVAFSVWSERKDLVIIADMVENRSRRAATFCLKSDGRICLLSCSSEPIEYSLLRKFFEVAEKALKSGKVNQIYEIEDPVQCNGVYCGCMLGVTSAEKQTLISEIRNSGKEWCDEIGGDDLYIVTGKDLSGINSTILDRLKDRWKDARIFTLPGFRNYIKYGTSGDADRNDYNKFISYCKFSPDGYFTWPSTDTYPGKGLFDPDNLKQVGVLSLMGYHVGRDGVEQSLRRAILRDAYLGPVPYDPFSEEMAEWDAPCCSARLKKIANCIAAFARNAKKRTDAHAYRQSIDDWESDLNWLKENFYIGVYDHPCKFAWPY